MAASVKTWTNDSPPQVDDVDLNGFEQENNLLISSSGQTLDDGDHTQTSLAVANYSAGADYYTCSGSLNSYILTESSIGLGTFYAPTEYFDGFRIRFLPTFANTGAATVNVAGIGVVDLLRADGTPLQQDDLSTNLIVEGVYFTTGFRVTNVGSGAAAGDVTNIVIGGCAGTNPWQRQIIKTSALTASNYVYLADRLYVRKGNNTTGQITYRKSTDAPSVTVSNYFSTNSFEIEVTTAQTTFPGADEGLWMGYAVEGYDYIKLASRNIVVSFVAKASVAGVYSVALTNIGQDQSIVKEINVTTSYQLFTLVFPPPPTSGTWNYTNEIGLNLLIGVSPSSYNTGSLDVWQAARVQTGAAQANLLGTNGAKFNLDQLFIAPGSVFNGYNEPDFPQLLNSCLRYYQKTYTVGEYAGDTTTTNEVVSKIDRTTTPQDFFRNTVVPLRKIVGDNSANFAIYDPTGVAGQFKESNGGPVINVALTSVTDKNITLGLTRGGGFTAGTYVSGFYTIDCELGIV